MRALQDNGDVTLLSENSESPNDTPRKEAQAKHTNKGVVSGRSFFSRHRILWGLSALVVAFFLAVGLLALRLFISPVSISSFLPQVEAYAEDVLPEGQDLDIEDVQISFAQSGGLALRLTNLSLHQGEQLLLSTPRIDLEIDFMALLKRQMRPKSILIPSMTARVQRDLDGRLLIAGQDPAAADEVMGPPVRSQAVFYDPDEPEFVSFIYSMRRAIKPLADDDLDKRPPRILIRDTEIRFRDELTAKSRVFHNVAFSYDPSGSDDDLWRIDFAVDGHNGRIGFAMAEFPTEEVEGGREGRSIEFRFEDVSLPDFSPRFADNSQHFQFSSPINGAAQMIFDPKGELIDMKVALDVEKGRIDFGPKDDAYLDQAQFLMDWDPDARALSLERGTVHFGETGGEFLGVAVWPEKRDGEVRIAIEGRDIQLAERDNPNPKKSLNAMVLHAKVARTTGVATIDRFAMLADEGSVQGAGSIAMVNGELAAGMSLVVSSMPYDLLTHMWPVSVANGARKWIIENVEGGRMTGGNIEFQLTESMLQRNEEDLMVLPDDSVHMTFGVEDVRIKGFGDLPPAAGLKGTGLVTGRKVTLAIDGGQFLTKAGRVFAINSGEFEIPDHSRRPATGILELEGSGDANAFGEIVDSEPLNVLKSEKQVADNLSGTASAKVKITFPFIKHLKKADVDYSANIQLRDFGSTEPLRGRRIGKAALDISTDGTRVEIAGKGEVDGLATTIDLVTSTDGSVALSSNFELQLNDADRKKLGLDLSSWIRGPVAVKISQGGGTQNATRIEADLTKAVLALDEIGWSKKQNVRGSATFELIETDSEFNVRSFELEGDGFSATGSADIGRDAGLKKLTISNLQLSRGDRLNLDVERNGSGGYALGVTGEVLDLRGRLLSGQMTPGAQATEGGSAIAGQSFRLNANVKRVIGLSGHVISDLMLDVDVRNGKERSIRARGLMDGHAQLDVETTSAEVPTVHVSTDDAGSLLRFFGAIDRVLGGRLALSVLLEDGLRKISGTVFLKDFNLGGQVQKGDARSAEPERVNSNFNKFTMGYRGEDGVISISNGIIKGPVLGATISGKLDMIRRQLALSGTYIPAYGVNNIFSRLPLIGRALGNRKNEGLLGITYKIEGSVSNPTVIVNPASILAPGALRKIFEF